MYRYVRVLALVLGAFTTTLAPCMPALTWAAPCAMAGCDDETGSRISAATCCCATTGAPATAGSTNIQLQGPVKCAQALTPASPAAAATSSTMTLAALVEPTVPVPIFLLNTSLLM